MLMIIMLMFLITSMNLMTAMVELNFLGESREKTAFKFKFNRFVNFLL